MHGLLDGFELVDVLDDEDTTRNDEEIPEDSSVEYEEDPEDDVEHVGPVKHLIHNNQWIHERQNNITTTLRRKIRVF